MPKLLPADIEFAEGAPHTASVSVEVHAPPERVWGLLVDHGSWPTWFEGVTSCVATSDPAEGVGSTRRIAVKGLRADEQFIAWEPNRLWGFCSIATNLPLARRWVELVAIEPRSEGSRIVYSTGFEPTLWTRWITRPLLRQIQGTWERSFRRIDDYIEA